MSFATLLAYVRAFFPELPAPHWIGMGVLALVLTVFLSLRRTNTGAWSPATRKSFS